MMKRNPLGIATVYPQEFSPQSLFPIARAQGRAPLGINGELPFDGYDVWNCYELSYLTPSHKPVAAILQLAFSCRSLYLIESKSLKLFLGSLNNHILPSIDSALSLVRKHLEDVTGAPLIDARLVTPELWQMFFPSSNEGLSIDNCPFDESESPEILLESKRAVREHISSNLLRSMCPVTGQPDWGTVDIIYEGAKLNHASILRYIVSLRNSSGFHEDTTEKLFLALRRAISPGQLLVACRYLRRGGIDITPIRFSPGFEHRFISQRHMRQ